MKRNVITKNMGITARNCSEKEKRKFYNNIDISLVTDNKKFWKTVSPLFSEKYFSKRKLILVEDNNVVSKDGEVAETVNTFFSIIA